MKRFVSTVLILVFASAASAADINGVWQTQPAKDGNYLQVTIEPCAANLCGIISGAFTSDHKSVSGYKDIGKQMIWDMKPNGPGKWDGGKIWSPENDVTADGKLELDGEKLEVSGCKGPICRSQDWTRVK
ncbi:DUF2147 domain-containing protein [Hoeflea prorocentri]|uniref:DUF2147 domain-containing protein n=1 Tax=Hoeflea prorocentri TaxID=1922333 RepID=A0A9X3UKG2_9HYPH|nr:DUF2147 domain-containing protein [Hoeflea prorocentri]MCY6380794.1 DUF2147 domain-containing protein [Hoeflea prorocentri]MDA5398594.1 DUF2147 domain-containing protein [Hoeflea prorocentri]